MSENDKPPIYPFILTGHNARGRRITDVVEATTGDAAVQAFADRGLSDIVLHTDDIAAPFLNYSKATLRPRDAVWARTHGPFQLSLFVTRYVLMKFWYLLLLPVGWLLYVLIRAQEWDFWNLVTLAAASFAILFIVGFVLWSFLRYARLLRAAGWARWDEVLRLLPRLSKSIMPKYEWPIRKAQALAGAGRLPQALAEFNAAWEFDELPEYVYWVFRAVVSLAAQDSDGAVDCFARAHELAPETPIVLVDYATVLLKERRDTRRARPLLAEARRHAISDTTLPYLLAAEGMLALEEGRPADAVGPLTESLRKADPFLRGNPSIIVVGARIRAYLCLALAATGDTTAARRHLQRARPLLIAHQSRDLIDRCEQAVG